MLKKRASAFSGTPLAGYLRSCGVDTILVTGVTATACVRTTICDGLADGFRTIAVKECIGDRVPGAVAWNLYDIDAKFADVEPVDTCVNYLSNVEGFNRGSLLRRFLDCSAGVNSGSLRLTMPIGATVRREGQARATMDATPTVQTVCNGLADPIAFVRRVLENMWPSGRDSIVRLSIASTPGAPDYLLKRSC
jgi:hypothetical protein